MDKMALLRAEHISKSYGEKHVLQDISIHLDQGELVSLVGANGAGKSTLLSAILGLVKIKQGEIIYKDENLVGKNYYEIVRKRIAIVPEGRQVFAGMTVEENLKLGSFNLKKDSKRDSDTMAQVFEYFPRLKERIKQPAGTMSGGEQQMLAVGRALMAHPGLLILDEPSMGLAPLVVNQVFDIIKKIKETGVTMLLIEQNANKALKISDRAYVLRTGNVIMEDKAENMLGNQALLESYLK